jgi:hypothetical protein
MQSTLDCTLSRLPAALIPVCTYLTKTPRRHTLNSSACDQRQAYFSSLGIFSTWPDRVIDAAHHGAAARRIASPAPADRRRAFFCHAAPVYTSHTTTSACPSETDFDHECLMKNRGQVNQPDDRTTEAHPETRQATVEAATSRLSGQAFRRGGRYIHSVEHRRGSNMVQTPRVR